MTEGYCVDAFNVGDCDDSDDEVDQVEEEEKAEGYDGPPVEEDDDEGKGANAEKGIRKEKWGKPKDQQYDRTSSVVVAIFINTI